MYSVSNRIAQIKQPRGGYVKRKDFEINSFNDDVVLNADENISPTLIGLCVDYMTRLMTGASKEDIFEMALVGADIVKERHNAFRLLFLIEGLDEKSIRAACQLVGYDICYKTKGNGYTSVEQIIPNSDTVENIIMMINRSLYFFRKYGPVVKSGIDFEGGYTCLISSGEADYLTEDTLWNLTVSREEPKARHTLQVLICYIMGSHSMHKEFKSVKNIGIFNPRLNKVYTIKIDNIPKEILSMVSDDVIGYNLSEEDCKQLAIERQNVIVNEILEKNKMYVQKESCDSKEISIGKPDYHHNSEEIVDTKENYIDLLLRLYEEDHNEIEAVRDYVKALAIEYLDRCDYRVTKLLKKIKILYSKFYFDEQISEEYSGCLSLLVLEQESYKSCKDTCNILSDIYSRFPNNEAIASDYSTGLSVLSNLIETEEINEIFYKSAKIYEQYPDNKEIKEQHTEIINNIKYIQREKQAKNNYIFSKKSYLDAPDNKECKKNYAMAIIEYMKYNEDDDIEKEAKENILDFYNQYSDDLDFIVAYATLLSVLSETEGVGFQFLIKLGEMYESLNRIEVAEIYAQALAEYSSNQDSHLKHIVSEIQKIQIKYEENKIIAIAFAEVLYALSGTQGKRKHLQTLEEIKIFSEKYPDISEIKELYEDGIDFYNWDYEIFN